jgi:hypothetical protein
MNYSNYIYGMACGANNLVAAEALSDAAAEYNSLEPPHHHTINYSNYICGMAWAQQFGGGGSVVGCGS